MKQKIVRLVLALFLLHSPTVHACTLWAANGDVVSGDGSLVVKNRDWLPNQRASIKMFTPETGYRYFGLYASGEIPGLKAGINEKGLVIVSASVDSIPANNRRAMPHTKNRISKLLTACASVDEVLTKSDLFVGPEILIIADKQKVATIEIGPNGLYSATVKQNGFIYHTNHYIDEKLSNFNEKIHQSSRIRYSRIAELLTITEKPFSFNTFVSFSNDQNDGPDNSIFRSSSTLDSVKTVAVWAVHLPPYGSPQLYVKLLNPGESEQILSLNADDVFNGKMHLE